MLALLNHVGKLVADGLDAAARVGVVRAAREVNLGAARERECSEMGRLARLPLYRDLAEIGGERMLEGGADRAR